MAPKKKNYKAPKSDEEDMLKFREHSKLIEEKSKTIIAKYAKWWDKDKKGWKEGFNHGKIC
jgi:hypothetical protein